jgi:opacity protein-like surface antigen
MKSILAATAAAVVLAASAPAAAVPLILDGGWYGDLVITAGSNADGGPFTFLLSAPAFLRLTDNRRPGDTFTATDVGNALSITSTFTTDGAMVPIDDDGVAWTDLSYSRFSLLLGPGSYSFDVTTQCESGCAAGFSIRLDSAPASPGVPEPASWAMLIAGFGLTGAAMRRRRVERAA